MSILKEIKTINIKCYKLFYIENQMISVLIIFLLWVEVSFNQWSNRTQDYIQENWFTSQINPKTNQEVMNVGSYSGIKFKKIKHFDRISLINLRNNK